MQQIPLPNYGAQAEAVVQGFDNLLEFHRERKQREKENRAFLREVKLRNIQNEFRADLQNDQQEFRADLQEGQQEFRKGLQNREEQFQLSMTQLDHNLANARIDKEHGLQKDLYDMKREDSIEDREDNQAHEMQINNANLASKKRQRALEQQEEATKKWNKLVESRQTRLDDMYSDALKQADIKYALTETEDGNVGVALQGGEFGEEGTVLPFSSFELKMQDYTRAYEGQQQWNQYAQENDVRRVNETASGDITIDDLDGEDSGEYTYLTREGMNQLYRKAYATGDFSKVKQIGEGGKYLLDERPSITSTPDKAISIYNNITSFGDPATGDYVMDFGEMKTKVNFNTMTYGELLGAKNNIEEQARLYEDPSDRTDTDPLQKKYKAKYNNLKERLAEFEQLRDEFASATGITGPELKDYRLATSGFDPADPSSYMTKKGNDVTTDSGYDRQNISKGFTGIE